MAETLLSQRLKELRKLHNYTQDYVASALGVVRQTYSHYETGKRMPNSETLYKLAGLYNVPIDDFMHLTIELDKNIYYDAPAPSSSSIELTEFLEYFNNPNNKKKYQYNTNLEKELLYYFEKISDDCTCQQILDTKYQKIVSYTVRLYKPYATLDIAPRNAGQVMPTV